MSTMMCDDRDACKDISHVRSKATFLFTLTWFSFRLHSQSASNRNKQRSLTMNRRNTQGAFWNWCVPIRTCLFPRTFKPRQLTFPHPPPSSAGGKSDTSASLKHIVIEHTAMSAKCVDDLALAFKPRHLDETTRQC
jgi:hypothetical protein